MDKNWFSSSILGLVFVVFVYALGGGISLSSHIAWFILLPFPIGVCLFLLSGSLGLGFDLFDVLDYVSCFVEVVLDIFWDMVYTMYDLLCLTCSLGVDFLKRMGWRLFVE